MCVSVAVETTGWYHAQQSWRRGEVVDRLAVFGPNSGKQAHPWEGRAGGGEGGGNGAASKSAPQAGKARICSTLQRQSGGIWVYNPQGQGDA